MKRKSIVLICGSIETEKTLRGQLTEYLGEYVDIATIPMDEGIEAIPDSDLLILSSGSVFDELIKLGFVLNKTDLLIAKRTINYEYIDQIVLLPEGTQVLFVNDVEKTVEDGIKALNEIGLDHISYIPYYPGIAGPVPELEIAITPGESDKVPEGIKKIYDIGPRIIDFSSLIEIVFRLDLGKRINSIFSDKYLKKIISVSKKMARYSNEIALLNDRLSTVIDSMNDGVLVYDINGNIMVINENLRKKLRIKSSVLSNKAIKDVIRNSSLVNYLMDKASKEDIIMEIDGTETALTKFPIFEGKSYIATFKNMKEVLEYNTRLRKEYFQKGFYAKYTFSDILGNSSKLNNLKNTAKKLAKTELTILIEGESGTGKELFASAIHNESRRSEGPYLAVNCSALPDELIESELFGYEEGAFTGAKKGGKPGLFEQCDGGTIFLDEIGDISLKMQARLLRVLESKEVMRIGGSEIKSVDVRIIAATNKDLFKKVQENQFREDLYYRLKMGFLRLMPLRERKEDIAQLFNYFAGSETTEKIEVEPAAMEKLINHNWLGNVRELKNVVSFIMAVRDDGPIGLKHLPDIHFFSENDADEIENKYNAMLTQEETCVIRSIMKCCQSGEHAGREKIWKCVNSSQPGMTIYRLRKILDTLEKKQIVRINRGRGGTEITELGLELLKKNGR